MHGNADPLSRHPCHQCGDQPLAVNARWEVIGHYRGQNRRLCRFQLDDPDIGQKIKWVL